MVPLLTAHSLYQTNLQGIMIVVLIKTHVQSKMMKTITMIPSGMFLRGNWPLPENVNSFSRTILAERFYVVLFVCLFVATWRPQDSQLDQLHHQTLSPSYSPVRELGPGVLKRICFPSSKELSDYDPEIHVWWIQEEISYLWCELDPSGHSSCGQEQITFPVCPDKYENQTLIFHDQVPEEKCRTSLTHGVLPLSKRGSITGDGQEGFLLQAVQGQQGNLVSMSEVKWKVQSCINIIGTLPSVKKKKKF